QAARRFDRQRRSHEQQEAGWLLAHVDVPGEGLERRRLLPRPAHLVAPGIALYLSPDIDDPLTASGVFSRYPDKVLVKGGDQDGLNGRRSLVNMAHGGG